MAGFSGKRRKVHRKDIENRFASAGWHLDGGFADHLVIGYSDEDGLSILARKEAWEADEDGLSILDYEEAWDTDDDDDPVFELIDHERDLTYRVWEDAPRARPAARRGGVLTSPKTLRLLLLGRARGPASCVDSGEFVHEPLVVLTRFGPGGEICFPGLGDGVHPPERATYVGGGGLPLGLAEPFVFHLPQSAVYRA